MIKRQAYERPSAMVLPLVSGGLLAGSPSKKDVKLDNKDFPDIKTDPVEGKPDEIDAKKNNSWGWNDSWNE